MVEHFRPMSEREDQMLWGPVRSACLAVVVEAEEESRKIGMCSPQQNFELHTIGSENVGETLKK